MNMGFEQLTKEELEKLEKRYGDLFWNAYRKGVFDELDRRERFDKFSEELEASRRNRKSETLRSIKEIIKTGKEDKERRDRDILERYGNLLDKYIK